MNTQIQINIQLHWLDQFNAHLSDTYTSTATINTALQHIRVFAKWFEAKFNEQFAPEKITNYALRQFQKHSLDEARVMPNTWNSRLWALDLFTKWIEATCGASYADLMIGLKNKEQGIHPAAYRSLSDKEIHDLMQQLERNIRGAVTAFEYETNKRDAALVTLMLRTGLRVAEVAALDISDITINERSGAVRVRNGKGSKERIVPLSIEARTALGERVGNSAAIALFDGKRSERLSTRQIERIVQYIGVQIGIPDMSPHWMRYTFAKTLERAGRPIQMICDLLGHESVETTRKYLRSSLDELQSAVEV
jgi:site-specific recombinase XerD